MISSDGLNSETDIDDLEQTGFKSCQLVSSCSGSNDTSTVAQAQGDGLTLNTLITGLVAKNRTKWEYINFFSKSQGELQTESVLTENESLTRYANWMLYDPLSAFELIVNNSMLANAQQCTETEAHTVRNSDKWKLPLSELKVFIFLLYVQGALCGKNQPILEFGDKNWGVPFFQNYEWKSLLQSHKIFSIRYEEYKIILTLNG